MNFTVKRTELLTALSICGKAVSSNGIVPALGNYLFEVKNNSLTIYGNNMEAMISKKITCQSKETLSIQIPSVRLKDWVNNCADQPLIFTIKDLDISIKSANGECSMSGELGEDYPKLSNKTADTMQINTDIFLSLIGRTLIACGSDMSLPLGGLFVEINNAEITCTGSDKNIFCSYSEAIDCNIEKSVLIPSKILGIINGLPFGETLSINIAGNSICFMGDGINLTIILMDMKYPDWRTFINKNNDKFIMVNRNNLLSAIKRTAIFAYEYVEFNINELGGLCLVSENPLMKESASELVDCEFKGEPINIAFSGAYLKAALGNIQDDNIQLHLSSHNRPMYFRTSENQEADNFTLVMPIVPA